MNSWLIEKPMGDSSICFQNFCENVLKLPARVCYSHVSAIPANNGTFKNRFKSHDVYNDFMSWCCTSRTAAARTRLSSCRIACATGSPSSTRRRSPTGSQARVVVRAHRRWLVGKGGYGLVANNQGIEASWRWDHSAISGGRQVRKDWVEELGKERGGRGGVGRKESAGLAGFSSHLHRQHAQEPQGALQAGRLRPGAHGSPQRLPVDFQSACF